MNAKHQFKYTYTDTDIEEISPLDITFDMPGEVTITQMLFNFECYLKACGFVFDGRLEMVKDGWDNLSDELDGTLYEFKDEELQDGCMADWDTDGGYVAAGEENDEGSSCCDKKKGNKEVKKNKWVHGICNPPSPDWKATNSQKEYVEDCKPTGKKHSSVQEMVDYLSNIKYKL